MRHPITSISTARCSATATSPRPRCSAQRATSARPRPTTSGRRTCAPPPCCARISATLTLADVERLAEHLPWGTPRSDRAHHRAADAAGANTVQISLNRGAMPQEMFIEQIRRFARDVLPRCRRTR